MQTFLSMKTARFGHHEAREALVLSVAGVTVIALIESWILLILYLVPWLSRWETDHAQINLDRYDRRSLFDLANFGQVVSGQKPVCVSGQCLRSSFGRTRRQHFAKHVCLCSRQG